MVPVVASELRSLKEQGDEAFSDRNFQRATEWYSEALEMMPDPVVLSNRSATYAMRQRFDKALLDADKALKLAPQWPRVYHRRGHALFHLGRYNEAVAAIQEGLKLDEKDVALLEAAAKLKEYTEPGDDFWLPNPSATMPQLVPEVEVPANGAASPDPPPRRSAPRAGAFSSASAKAKGNSSGGSKKLSAEELRERGNAFFRDGNHSKAVRAYDEAIRANPSDARCWANRAAAQMAMLAEFGRGLSPAALRTNPYYNNSLDDLKQSLKLDEKYIKAWARLGQLHAMASEFSEAMAAYEKGLALDPEHPDCLAGKRACEGGH